MIEICIDGFPVPQGRPRGVIVPPLPLGLRKRHSVRFYSPADTRKWMAEARFFATQTMKEQTPLKGQLIVEIRVYLVPPQSTSNKKRVLCLSGQIRPTTRPDADNYAKAVLDACNGVAWIDDAQIVRLTVDKFYAEKPRVEITIEERPYPFEALELLQKSVKQAGLFK